MQFKITFQTIFLETRWRISKENILLDFLEKTECGVEKYKKLHVCFRRTIFDCTTLVELQKRINLFVLQKNEEIQVDLNPLFQLMILVDVAQYGMWSRVLKNH